MAELRLPRTLMPLFSDLPRRIEVDAPNVAEAIAQLEERWPGVRDRLCDPGPVLRQHIHIFVVKERAQLDTPLDPRSQVDVVTAISGG
jgi:molybdopterin synthase sulfur carrier subunit